MTDSDSQSNPPTSPDGLQDPFPESGDEDSGPGDDGPGAETGLDIGKTGQDTGYAELGSDDLDPDGDDTDEDGEKVDTSDIGYDIPAGGKEPSA